MLLWSQTFAAGPHLPLLVLHVTMSVVLNDFNTVVSTVPVAAHEPVTFVDKARSCMSKHA